MATTGLYRFKNANVAIYDHYDNYEYGAAVKLLKASLEKGYSLAANFIRANEKAEIVNEGMVKTNYTYTIDEKTKTIQVENDEGETETYSFEEFYDKFAGKVCENCNTRVDIVEVDWVNRNVIVTCECGEHKGESMNIPMAINKYNVSF